ncbi:FkbM family methyltransferase [Salinirussus salinus]|uniref:FkbM family methyltransferase n=1 Tax=Salinirussus salinus TaxID=1198300 RepID=UPI00135B1F60|nr:FkbM family methyltransferase [Salinirussus salinus]
MASSLSELISSAYQVQRNDGTRALIKKLDNRIERYLKIKKAERKDSLELECNSTNVIFDTTTLVSKDWFYPRYLDGTLHEPEITKELIDSLGPDTVFYDIGALVGYYTIFASEICKEGKVHAFELDSQYLNAIQKSLARNGTDAILNHKAISHVTGEKLGYSGDVGFASINKDENTVQTCSVETISLDEYTKNNAYPDIMKIDIEGFEYNALKGSKAVFEAGYPKKLFLELHPPKIRSYGGSIQEILSILKSNDYECKPIAYHRGDKKGARAVTTDDINKMENVMIICTRPDHPS